MSDNRNNTGNCNTGDRNTGSRNTGNYNTGNYNTGDCNTGDCNTGDYNTGDYNTGDCNTGHFNTTTPTVRMFNKDTGLLPHQIKLPLFHLPITEWVRSEDMTAEEKSAFPIYTTIGGYLKKRTYKEAFAIAWNEADKVTRAAFLSLPNFDAGVFEEITGVCVSPPLPAVCAVKEVVVDGVKYKLVKVE